MSVDVPLGSKSPRAEAVDALLDGNARLRLVPADVRRIRVGRRTIEKALAGEEPVYGVNTGVGKLRRTRIPPSRAAEMQVALLRSHAAGVGPPLPVGICRLALALKLRNLASGRCGVREKLVRFLTRLVDRDVIPVLPSRGSVGASGDLAPLAHMGLVCLGEGDVYDHGKRRSARAGLKRIHLKPIRLAAKEALSLINGTQVSAAIGLAAWREARTLVQAADLVGAMSLEGIRGTPAAFDPRLVRLRPHPGSRIVAANLRRLLAGSAIRKSHADCDRVQDPYSFRCMPQIHGAVRDAVDHAGRQLLAEANGISDNPLVLGGRVVSGGNFHAQAAAMASDHLALAMTTLANVSERRISQLMDPETTGLPPFLTRDPGVLSGFMMAQVTAAALASENKVLAHPSSADTVPTSGNQEDHVSMAPAAGLHALQVARHAGTILAIEIAAAAEALDLLKPLAPGKPLAAAHRAVRRRIPPYADDRPLADLIPDWETTGPVAWWSGPGSPLAACARAGTRIR